MTKIRFKLKKSREYQIKAQTIDAGSGDPDKRDGNVDTLAGTKIMWGAKSGGSVEASKYTVEFRNLQDEVPVWPFVEKADGTGVAPPGYLGPLVLSYDPASKNYSSVSLTTRSANLAAKYTVTAEPMNPSDTIDVLDPMIIIRPQSLAVVNVVFGVTCAVLGAVAGVLFTRWLM